MVVFGYFFTSPFSSASYSSRQRQQRQRELPSHSANESRSRRSYSLRDAYQSGPSVIVPVVFSKDHHKTKRSLRKSREGSSSRGYTANSSAPRREVGGYPYPETATRYPISSSPHYSENYYQSDYNNKYRRNQAQPSYGRVLNPVSERLLERDEDARIARRSRRGNGRGRERTSEDYESYKGYLNGATEGIVDPRYYRGYEQQFRSEDVRPRLKRKRPLERHDIWTWGRRY